jgi:hypothetical protein
MFVYLRGHVGMHPLSQTHAWHYPVSIVTIFTNNSPVLLHSIYQVTRPVTLNSVVLLPLHFLLQ